MGTSPCYRLAVVSRRLSPTFIATLFLPPAVFAARFFGHRFLLAVLFAGLASPSVGLGPPRGIDAQSSRDGISSGGEEDGEEEDPWSARDLELLVALVRNYGKIDRRGECFVVAIVGDGGGYWFVGGDGLRCFIDGGCGARSQLLCNRQNNVFLFCLAVVVIFTVFVGGGLYFRLACLRCSIFWVGWSWSWVGKCIQSNIETAEHHNPRPTYPTKDQRQLGGK